MGDHDAQPFEESGPDTLIEVNAQGTPAMQVKDLEKAVLSFLSTEGPFKNGPYQNHVL